MQTDVNQPFRPSLVVKRGRLGNFRFSFTSGRGNLNGTVTVAMTPGQSQTEAEEAACRKILALIHSFADVTK